VPAGQQVDLGHRRPERTLGGCAWAPGDVILWREVWRGRAWLVYPVRVVADDGETLVVYLAEGTRLGFPPDAWPWPGGHPWSRPGRWRGHGVLQELRAGRPYGVWHFWTGPERRFAGWYLNLQRPPERHASGIDTLDHELDLWVAPDGTIERKDDEKLEGWIERGRWGEAEVAAIRADGARALADRPWPTGWEGWQPDPAWPVPVLPDGWDAP
jgi:hypothetical protein